jgi:hypothetical protein
MPSYKITDSVTGKSYKVTGDSPPTESEMLQIFGDFKESSSSDLNAANMQPKHMADRAEFLRNEGTIGTRIQNSLPSRETVAKFLRPTLAGGGAVAGGIIGLPLAPETMGMSSVAGAGLGYAGGARLADMIEGKQRTIQDAITQSLQDTATGATYEMGGQSAIPLIRQAVGLTGKIVKPILGTMSGTGKAVDEAVQSGKAAVGTGQPFKSVTDFDKALRGNISGEEIVDTAKSALQTMKNNRASAYQAKMQQIQGSNPTIDLVPIKQDLVNLMDRYNVKFVNGAWDTSRVPMGASGRRDIADIIDTINGWGKQSGDDTAIGLDTLKRQLDDFYSDNSQARQFVTEIRNKVKDALVANVQGYDDMTKGYADATKVIKDMEADLTLRKNGMSGRTTADKTLRRLMSSMRDNFEMRKELVDILSQQGSGDLTGQIAGYTMNPVIPRGLVGRLGAGTAGYLAYLNPKMAAVVVASSPRVQGEFLRLFGRSLGEVGAIGTKGQKAILMQSGISAQEASK